MPGADEFCGVVYVSGKGILNDDIKRPKAKSYIACFLSAWRIAWISRVIFGDAANPQGNLYNPQAKPTQLAGFF